jgi:hypothetical protein
MSKIEHGLTGSIARASKHWVSAFAKAFFDSTPCPGHGLFFDYYGKMMMGSDRMTYLKNYLLLITLETEFKYRWSCNNLPFFHTMFNLEIYR